MSYKNNIEMLISPIGLIMSLQEEKKMCESESGLESLDTDSLSVYI